MQWAKVVRYKGKGHAAQKGTKGPGMEGGAWGEDREWGTWGRRVALWVTGMAKGKRGPGIKGLMSGHPPAGWWGQVRGGSE